MIVCADARRIPLADESVQCVVTSPPYWGLRKYAGEQELMWGGRDDCEHGWHNETHVDKRGVEGTGLNGRDPYKGGEARVSFTNGRCEKCGAWRGAYGLEPTVEMYVQHTIEILREIQRVLRADGVCFWNIGDSYAGSWGNQGRKPERGTQRAINGPMMQAVDDRRYPSKASNTGKIFDVGLKPKDLCLIPQRVTFAAQADGWWIRSDIIWAKPNPMPESVCDRPTDAYEHILMLTKSARYYWDADAVAEPVKESTRVRLSQPSLESQHGSERVPGKTNGPMKAYFGGRNKHSGYGTRKHSGREDDGNYLERGRNLRNVWTFPTQPYKGAHFATFPEELPRRCILASTKPGDLVLDPFGGSGTTGRVAIELNRRVVLLDLAYTHDYAALANQRTTNVQRELRTSEWECEVL